jgi:hypothetical protein
MRTKRILCYLLSLLLVLILSGCGNSASSGSGSTTTTVSGVAAKGIPISGPVTLKDKIGVQRGPVVTDVDGKFSLDVTGLTPPFILKAEYTTSFGTYPIFSIATGAGIANINPFTDLTLSLAINSDPALVFANQTSVQESALSKASIDAAQLRLKTKLAPLLEKYGVTAFAPLDAAYSATPDNKLDAMLDLLSTSTTYGMLSIYSKLGNESLVDCRVADFASASLDLSKASDASVLTDMQELRTMLSSLQATMNLGASLTLNALEDYFIPEANYRTSEGNYRADDMASVIAIFGPGGTNPNGRLKSIRNVQLISDMTATYTARGVDRVYKVKYDFLHDNGFLVHGHEVTIGKETTTGKWKFIGSPPSGIGNSGLVITEG